MPTMQARRRGPCAVCGANIEIGEVMAYEQRTGPRHLACSDRAGERRTNARPSRCAVCQRRLARGQGRLSVREWQTGDHEWRRAWDVVCIDASQCI